MSYLLYSLSFILLAIQVSAIVIFQNGRIRPDVPRVGIDPGYLNWRRLWRAKMDFFVNGKEIVKKAYNKFKNGHYLLQMLYYDVLVVAPKFLPELEMLPEATLSKDYDSKDAVHYGTALKELLRTSVPHIIASQAEELEHAFSDDLMRLKDAKPDEYLPYNLLEAAFLIVTRLSARFIVGNPLCRDKNVVWSIIQFNIATEAEEFSLAPIPKFFHPWIKPVIYPTWKKARETYSLLGHTRFPIEMHVRSARIKMERVIVRNPVNEGKVQDHTVLKLLASDIKSEGSKKVATKLLSLAGSMRSSSVLSITRALYDLCIMPENIDKLRTEAQQALEATGGDWTMDTISSLRHLDSFIKESMRLEPPTYLGFHRLVNYPIKLSDGTILPPEQPICIATGMMGRDSTYYTEPSEFQADRFYSPPLSYTSGPPSEAPDKSTATSNPCLLSDIEPGNLNWGAGRFACPGRWYAAAMMKLVVATILLKYDIKFPEGHDLTATVCPGCGQKKAFEHDILVRKRVQPKKIDEDYVEVSRRSSGSEKQVGTEDGNGGEL